jgi:hypothetical protein
MSLARPSDIRPAGVRYLRQNSPCLTSRGRREDPVGITGPVGPTSDSSSTAPICPMDWMSLSPAGALNSMHDVGRQTRRYDPALGAGWNEFRLAGRDLRALPADEALRGGAVGRDPFTNFKSDGMCSTAPRGQVIRSPSRTLRSLGIPRRFTFALRR